MHELIKPSKLSLGDKVAAITLSWGGAGLFPHRYEIGKKRLQEVFGLEVIETKHALKDPKWIYENPEARAEDLMEAFMNPSIKGIFSIIGGDDSIRLIPYIDFNIIKQNPKIFLGYSDSTITHFMCLKSGLSSFYGPSIMTAFAENQSMHNYTVENLQKTLFSTEVIGKLPQNKEGWTVEFLDWSNPENQNIKRKLLPTTKWRFISGNAKTRGRLIGGCVETLNFMQGTQIWPDLDQWKGSILFIETSEEGMSYKGLERVLRNLGAQGILTHLQGIFFGRPGGSMLNPDSFSDYDQAILKILKEFKCDSIPVVTHMDFGHTDPMLVIPYGCLAEIDVAAETITFLEKGVV